MKGARKYRKSKRVKEKARTTYELRQKHRAAMRAANAVQVHHASAKPSRKVRFDQSVGDPTRLHCDDFMRAYILTDELHDLHIDYAHTIAIGYHNQRYYLVMVIDGKDFLWASPTTTKDDPEALLEEFPVLSNP
mmetsp:Transcript_32813/g.67774  ORF Transcript_32813/g.67774 Transcript_32813/m.67774 type:complete len:134 (-) Transcript_32813:212-613(-)